MSSIKINNYNLLFIYKNLVVYTKLSSVLFLSKLGAVKFKIFIHFYFKISIHDIYIYSSVYLVSVMFKIGKFFI